MRESVRQVHMPDETAEYGIKFVRKPTKDEKESVRQELIRQAKKTTAHKKYNADSPSFLKALELEDSDEWVKAIKGEYKNLNLEKTWEAVLV